MVWPFVGPGLQKRGPAPGWAETYRAQPRLSDLVAIAWWGLPESGVRGAHRCFQRMWTQKGWRSPQVPRPAHEAVLAVEERGWLALQLQDLLLAGRTLGGS